MVKVSGMTKAVAALALVVPLALVGCSSEKKDEAQASATSSVSETTSVSSASEAPSEAPSPEPETPTSDPVQVPAELSTQEEAPVETPVEIPPLPTDITIQPAAPVDGGRPADEAEAQQIGALVHSLEGATTLRAYFQNFLDNTCARVIDANGGRAAMDVNQFPEVPLEAIPNYANTRPTVNDISDIRVDGDTASASVTVTAGGQTQTSTMRFLNEGGAWKMCD